MACSNNQDIVSRYAVEFKIPMSTQIFLDMLMIFGILSYSQIHFSKKSQDEAIPGKQKTKQIC